MKLTVLSILILLLVAGLVMIQMDANTENQIQVLRETEMLTTQGLGDCEQVVNNADMAGGCSDLQCFSVGWAGTDSQAIPIFAERMAVAYNKCDGPHPTKDCFETNVIINGKRVLQTCAEMKFYHWFCHPMMEYYSFPITRPTYADKPGCGVGGGGGGGTVGSTTS